ncbi:hypothetical protein ACO0SA_000631 [Hanseniaspora valbyensis]
MFQPSKILRVISQHNQKPNVTPARYVFSGKTPIGMGLLGFFIIMGIAYPKYVEFENKKIHTMYDQYGGKDKHNYYVDGEKPVH